MQTELYGVSLYGSFVAGIDRLSHSARPKSICLREKSPMMGGNRDRGSSHLLAPPTPPYKRVRIRRFSKLSPCGPEVRVVVRHKGFAARQVSVSASPSSEPVKLSRS